MISKREEFYEEKCETFQKRRLTSLGLKFPLISSKFQLLGRPKQNMQRIFDQVEECIFFVIFSQFSQFPNLIVDLLTFHLATFSIFQLNGQFIDILSCHSLID